jgi:hypothetical protein
VDEKESGSTLGLSVEARRRGRGGSARGRTRVPGEGGRGTHGEDVVIVVAELLLGEELQVLGLRVEAQGGLHGDRPSIARARQRLQGVGRGDADRGAEREVGRCVGVRFGATRSMRVDAGRRRCARRVRRCVRRGALGEVRAPRRSTPLKNGHMFTRSNTVNNRRVSDFPKPRRAARQHTVTVPKGSREVHE